jgi:hypothetical protein
MQKFTDVNETWQVYTLVKGKAILVTGHEGP